MFEHFDDGARLCVVLAQEEARRLGHEEIGTVHLLLGVVRVAPELLGVEVETVRAAVVALHGSGPLPTAGMMPFTAEGKATLEGANGQALALGHTTIDIAHVLLALLDAGGGGPRALREAGAIPATVRERALALAGSGSPAPPASSAGWTAYAAPGTPPDPGTTERLREARERHARLTRTPPAELAARLRDGHPVTVTLGDDGLPFGDLGHPNVDRQLLELLLVNDTRAARLLRAHGIDEAGLHEALGAPPEPPA